GGNGFASATRRSRCPTTSTPTGCLSQTTTRSSPSASRYSRRRRRSLAMARQRGILDRQWGRGVMTPKLNHRRLGMLVAGGALALVGFVVVQMPLMPSEGVVEAVRDPGSDAGYREVGDTAAGAYSFNFTSVNATTRAESAHATAVPPDARVLASTIAVYNFDDSLVMQRLGRELFKQLRDSKRFEKVHYLPLGERLADGERVPDLFVTLDLNAWQES